jgi:hypothetical protein
MNEDDEVRPARTWPHLSEIEGYLVAFEPLTRAFVPLTGFPDATTERITCRVHVIDPPIGDRHQAILVDQTSHVIPCCVGTMFVAALGIVSSINAVGRRFVAGRPYRYELRTARRGDPRRRAWGLSTPTEHEFRLVDRYTEELS